jgi:hypothetical protein
MAGPKIDKLELRRLLRHGKLQNKIAQLFGVTTAAISKAKKGLTMKGDHKKFTGKDLCSLNKVVLLVVPSLSPRATWVWTKVSRRILKHFRCNSGFLPVHPQRTYDMYDLSDGKFNPRVFYCTDGHKKARLDTTFFQCFFD